MTIKAFERFEVVVGLIRSCLLECMVCRADETGLMILSSPPPTPPPFILFFQHREPSPIPNNIL